MSSLRPRVVFSPHYNIGFPGMQRLHPFDIRKYGRAWKLLRKELGPKLTRAAICPPRAMRWDELLAVHSQKYLDDLHQPAYLARALEVPILRRVPAWLTHHLVLRPMLWATMGTVIAAREAMQGGIAVNLSGGYHHAGPERGEGFSLFNDIALAVNDLRASGKLGKEDCVAYVDLDAHQGNGVCHVFFDDRRVFIFDMYDRRIYPLFDVKAKRRIDCNVPMMGNCTEAEYLATLAERLPQFLDGVTKNGRVKLALYNAGTDVYRDDPLAGLDLTEAGVLRRDQFVLKELVTRKLPTVMVLSGGYTAVSHRLVANTVRFILTELS